MSPNDSDDDHDLEDDFEEEEEDDGNEADSAWREFDSSWENITKATPLLMQPGGTRQSGVCRGH